MKEYDFIEKNIGGKACVVDGGDIAMNRDLKNLIFNRTELFILGLDKSGMVNLIDSDKNIYKVPQRNIRLKIKL